MERLCTYQYSLISLIPGTSPRGSYRPVLTDIFRSSSNVAGLRLTSLGVTCAHTFPAFVAAYIRSPKFMGLPRSPIGSLWKGACFSPKSRRLLVPKCVQDAFFQPYIPLQQLDLIRSQSCSFLCGSTNAIVRQQKDIELLVDIESCSIEFRDTKIERAVALTPADRKWVDEIVKDVNDTWDNEDAGMRWVHILFVSCLKRMMAEGSRAVMTIYALRCVSSFVWEDNAETVA